ncbi:hypothetical protein ABR738_22255 [Streptomyces sp. Edi4]|uniref:hypothetical protein n=1 Tax=Streptomyces sp. Edi4 TaxID=3162527 RepID=UPI003305CB99
MTRTVVHTAARRTRAGIVGDGVFKVVLAAVYLVGAVPLGRLLGVSGWLMAVSGVALLACGGIEIRHARDRSARTCLRLMAAYDIGWVVTAAVGLLLARQSSTAGGEVWVGYQAAAAVAFAALLLAADPAPTPPTPR